METNRKDLLTLLERVHVTATKDGAPENKIATGLRKILEKHIRAVPGDRGLMTLFLEKGTVGFCLCIRDRWAKDISAPFSSAATTTAMPTTLGGSSSTRKRTLDRLCLTMTQRVDYDPGPEPFPTAEELRVHYRSVLATVFYEYPDLVAPPEAMASHRKLVAEGPYADRCVPSAIHHFLSLVRKVETDPPLFPLVNRLERLLLDSLLAFLPMSETARFLGTTWDGGEETLQEWECRWYHEPMARIVRDAALSEAEKQTRLRFVLSHWAKVERCHALASLRPSQLQEFLRLASHRSHTRRKMNAPVLLDAMASSGRRVVILDLGMNPLSSTRRLTQYFAFWDLSWMPAPRLMRRTLVPMDAATLPLSEKQFASLYFDPSTVYSKDDDTVLLWGGKVPFRVEYIHDGGGRTVQTATMYEAHKRHRETTGWRIPVRCLPRQEREVWNGMMVSWVSSALTSFLVPQRYDIPQMARLISRPLLRQTTLADMATLAYEVVGRLHPFFPLSRHHGVLRERIRHLYFSLEKLVELPMDLVFPEYFLAKDEHRVAMDKVWDAHFEEFQSCLLTQCACESFGAAGAGTLTTAPHTIRTVSRVLDRNIHIREDRTVRMLGDDGWEVSWEDTDFFWDEDIVPQGLEALGLFVEAPSYYRPTCPAQTLSETDLCRFLDGFVTMPGYRHHLVYHQDDDVLQEEEEEEPEPDDDEEDDVICD